MQAPQNGVISFSESKKCGCGRSPTGDCIGWHGLTNEQYKVKLNEWNLSQDSGKQLLNETKAID